MAEFNQVLLFLHFLGLALGLSASFANLVMGGLMAGATPSERAVLGRFPPTMSRLGRHGLELLWVSGLILVYTKWGGFAALTWHFHVKLTAVVLLTAAVIYMLRLQRAMAGGDQSAAPRLAQMGKVALALSLVAVAFAVLTFD
ncbi:MAG: hypothetical protein AB1635_15965 [Acidobacteriota bacterium]